jgi:hypothetical protein
MSILNKIGEGIFRARASATLDQAISLVEQCSRVYPFETVERRPHLTMEFPTIFDKRDLPECVQLRTEIYQMILPAIREYICDNNLSHMYPKKDFITISKLLPGPGMRQHVDNVDLKSNHFICMLYLNDNFSGGEIAFNSLDFIYKPQAGDILIYRASIPHEVLPVITGTRYSIGYGLTD